MSISLPNIADLRTATAAHLPSGSVRRRLVVSSGWALSSAILSRGATMATWVICARLLSQSEFGMLTLIYNTVISAGILAACGLGVTTTRYVAQLRNSDPARAGRIIRLSAILSAGFGALLAIVVVVVSRPIAVRLLGHADAALLVTVSAGMIMLNASNAHQTGTLAGLEAFRDVARLSLWTGSFAAVTTAVATYLAGLYGAIYGLLIAQTVTWIFYHATLKRRCREAGIDVRAPFWFREAGVLLMFSLPALLTTALSSPIYVITQWWLARLPNGMTQLALYGAADRWRLVILFLPTSLFQVVLPALSNAAGESESGVFKRIVRANVVIAVLVVLAAGAVCAISAQYAMGLFGRGYEDSGAVLLILCLSAVPQVLNGVIGQAIVTRSMWTRFGFDVLLFAILVSAAYLLVPRSGANGLALSYLVAFGMVTPLLFIYARKKQLI